MFKKIYSFLIRFSKLHSRKNLYKFLTQAIKKLPLQNKRIINIGSGGQIKELLIKHNIRFKELDIDKKRKPDYVCSVEDMPIFKDNSIDIFFCMEVLEHVKNPFKAVQEMERALAFGGIIIGSTPFMMPIHDEPYDFYRYTKYGIKNLFKSFKKIRLIERNSYIESIYVILLRLMNIGTIKQRVIGILLYPIIFLTLLFASSLYLVSISFTAHFKAIAASFGSIITLGIGPIVMSSIILQLLTGAGIIILWSLI